MTSEAGTPDTRRRWRDALRIYLHPRVLAMLFLGFSAGLPFPLVGPTLTAWLADSGGISMTDVGLFSLVGLFYSLKFVWAPLIDRARLPGLTAWLGRRRAWMLTAQIAIAGGLFGMSALRPEDALFALAGFACLVAFASATQDIVVDAWRIEAVDSEFQGGMAATYQLGYRIALLLGLAGVLVIADTGTWSQAYQLMALAAGVGIVTTLLVGEPDSQPVSLSARSPAEWLARAIIEPFTEFFRRYGRHALLLLLFVSLYRFTDLVLGAMANPFYIRMGFSLTDIATITKVFGFFVTIGGAALGGVAVARYGLARPLIAGAVMLVLTNLLFAGLAAVGEPRLGLLTVTIGADNLAAGFTGTVFIAYLSSLTSVSYTATQYALFSSLMVLPGKLFGGISGLLVDSFDWVNFFLIASAMGLPAIGLALYVARVRSPDEVQ